MRARVGLVAVAVVVGLSACGVTATDTPIKVPGGGVAAGVDVAGDTTFIPPDPSTVNLPRDVITSFLEAGVGGGDAAVRQARKFLTPKAAETLNLGQAPQPLVLRLLAPPNPQPGTETTTVSIKYQVVGTFTDQGYLNSSGDPREHQDSFTLSRHDGIWSIDVLPAIMQTNLVISDDMLDSPSGGYRARPIYFWDHSGSLLVPDLRYLPLTMDVSQRPNTIVDWLIAGPSPLLLSNHAVQNLPTGTAKIGNVASNAGAWVVNLHAIAGNPDDLHNIALQLRWSLLSVTQDKVELQIEGQRKDIGSALDRDAKDANPTHLTSIELDVVKKKINQPRDGIPVLASGSNANVVTAAVNLETTRAAFVTERNGQQSLTLVRETSNQKTSSSYPASGLPDSAKIGRPAFVGNADRLFVPVDGDLYSVAPTGAATKITPPGMSDVTSVAVPPDGRRIALVSGGHAYVASLVINGPSVIPGPPQEIAGGMLKSTAIAWLDSNHLVIVGSTIDGNAPAMVTSTVDGAAAKATTFSANGFTLVDVVTQIDVAASDIVVQTSDQKIEKAFTSGTLLPVSGVDSILYTSG